ncbi:MAG: T9SS type A sorting domain-containing protein [Candidatus Eisenbacteria bacterium]|nr:T9SS type A sorting domain-containing protein [Candidatus Eisenbacteria bacterium]
MVDEAQHEEGAMSSRKILLPCSILFLSILFLVAAATLGSAAMQMRAQVVASGGAQMQGEDFAIRCTVGQPGIGVITNPWHIDNVGFWGPVWWSASDTPEPVAVLPASFALRAAFPNPLSEQTTIRYAVPRRSIVSVKLYDPLGREVRALVDGWSEPGDRIASLDASGLPGGVYLCRMVAEGFAKTEKLVVVK